MCEVGASLLSGDETLVIKQGRIHSIGNENMRVHLCKLSQCQLRLRVRERVQRTSEREAVLQEKEGTPQTKP